MHVVLKLNDEEAEEWSDEDVVRGWGRLFPPRGKDRKTLEVSKAWVEPQLKDAEWRRLRRIPTIRRSKLGWIIVANRARWGTSSTSRQTAQGAMKFWKTNRSGWCRSRIRREHGGSRVGVSPHMNLAGYLQLLDWSSRLLRAGKARVPKEVAGILDRLGSSPDFWQHRLEKLSDRSRIFGTVFATKRSDINRMAESRGVRKLSNLNGCHG